MAAQKTGAGPAMSANVIDISVIGDEAATRPVPRRLTELDGIRGWASLMVVLFHVFWEAFGVRHPGFRNLLSAGLLNGRLSVCIFFVLSGEALSTSFFVNHDRASLARMVAKRYLRLTIPIFVSCLVVFVLMSMGLTFGKQAAVILGREDWLGQFIQFSPSFTGLLRYSLVDVYLNHQKLSSYNPFLWTMSIEMLGSMIVFLLLFCEPYLRRPVLVFGGLAIALLAANSFLGCFAAGMMFSRLRNEGLFERLQSNRLLQFIVWPGIVFVYFFVGWAMLRGHEERPALWLAPLLLFGFFSSRLVTYFFASTGVSQWLGKISFPLYVMQFPVYVSVMSFIVVRTGVDAMTTPIVWAICLLTIVATLAVATACYPMELWAQRSAQRFAEFVIRR